MRNYTIIGLTGPTGAGKSTAAQFFEKNGFVIVDADKIARLALSAGSSCLTQVCGVFGNDILNGDGSLNRRKLAQRAFADKESTQMLNDITHPWIFLRVLRECRQNIDNGKNRILFDAPVLFESFSDIMCDVVVSVVAPKEIRLERLVQRDGLSAEQIKKRMSAQHDNDFYISRSDFVIDGSLSFDEIGAAVSEIVQKL